MKKHAGNDRNKKSSIRARHIFAAAGFVPVLYTACHAATYTWTGTTSSTWSTAGNWTPTGGPPNSGSTALLPTSVTSTLPTVTASAQLGTLLISSTTGGWTIGDANSAVLSITGTSNSINDTAQVSGTTTFSVPLQVDPPSSTTQSWSFGTGAASYTVNLSGGIDLNGDTLTLNGNSTTGTGTVNVGGNIISSASGSVGNITYAGSSVSRDTFVISGTNSYVGTTIVQVSTVSVNSIALTGTDSALGAGGAVQIGNSSSSSNLIYTGTGATSDRLFDFYNQSTPTLTNNGTGPLILTNTGNAVAAVGTGNSPVILSGTNTSLTPNSFAELIANVTGTTTLQKSGVTSWQLTNTNNSYSGPTNIQVGNLLVDNVADAGTNCELGSGSLINLGTSASTGTLEYVGSTPAEMNRTLALAGITAGGGAVNSSGTGALDLSYTGPLVAASATASLTFQLVGTNTGNNIFSQQIVNATGGAATKVLKNQTGSWILANNSNSYTGTTTLQAGTLEIGADGAINNGAGGVVFTGGTLQFNNYTSNLNFNNDASLSLGAATGTPSTLSGTISGTSALTFAGPGTLALGASNNYSGGTTLNAGVLNFSSIGNLGSGPITFNGGTLQYASAYTGSTDISAVAVTLAVSGGTIDTNGNNVSLANSIGNAGAGSLTKIGSGTLTLSSANNYTGGTNATGGTLVIAPTTTPNVVALPANSAVSVGAAGNLQLADNASAGTPFVSSATDISNQLMTMSSLSIAAGGVLDVRNNHFYVADSGGPDDATYQSILGYVSNGANSISNGVITSTEGLPGYGIGIVDGNDGILGTPVSAGQIEVAYTLEGDANLDGKVDITDFNIFAPSFGLPTTLGWEAGDFDYSGTVDIGDFNLFAGNFGLSDNGTAVSMPAADVAALDAFAAANGLSLTSVPEPASLSLLIMGVVGVMARRRRSSRYAN